MLIGYLLEIDLDTFENSAMVMSLFKWICGTVSPLCFAIGTWYYLQRVEP
jgi:hypothetical protein